MEKKSLKFEGRSALSLNPQAVKLRVGESWGTYARPIGDRRAEKPAAPFGERARDGRRGWRRHAGLRPSGFQPARRPARPRRTKSLAASIRAPLSERTLCERHAGLAAESGCGRVLRHAAHP